MKTTLSFERLLRVLPPVLTVLLVVVCLVVGSRISWSNLLTYTPPNLLLAAVGILALYAVKSLSVVFPLSADSRARRQRSISRVMGVEITSRPSSRSPARSR